MARNKNQGLEWVTKLPDEKDFNYWSERFKNRQEEYSQTQDVFTNNIELSLPDDSTIVFFGDQHIGGVDTFYDRIEAEVKKIVETPNTYVIFMGDTVDGYFWGGESQYEQIEQVPEQYQYVDGMMNLLGEKGKIIGGILGDHSWTNQKGGFKQLREAMKRHKCFYSHGVTYITINIGDAKYFVTAAHRLLGNSQYNFNHPQSRAMRFGGAIGSDIIVSGHTHKKQISQIPVDKFGGETQVVHLISLGAYKASDSYGRKLGFNKLTPEGMFGCACKLSKDNKKIVTHYDILEALG